MNSFFTYLRTPKYLKSEKIDWNHFFKLFLLLFILNAIYSPIHFLIGKIINIQEKDLDVSIFYLLLGTVIIVPIIEEIIFRLILKPTFKNLNSILVFSFCLSIFSIFKHNINLFIISFSVFLIILFLRLKKRNMKMVQYFILIHFKYIFFISCILFGFSHILNFDQLTIELLLISPFLIIPQVIGGFFLGYIRMKFGILFSILFHSLLNLIPAIILLISKLGVI